MSLKNISILTSMQDLSQELNDNQISVLSWNILLKYYAGKDKMIYSKHDDLIWKNRKVLITKILKQYNSDIICLQEVDRVSFADDFGNEFDYKYGYATNKAIVTDKKTSVTLSNVTMYDKYKYKLLFNKGSRCQLTVLFNQKEFNECHYCNNSTLKTIDELIYSLDNTYNLELNDKICLNHCVFVINVHLSGRRGNDNLRLSQIKKPLNRLNYALKTLFDINKITDDILGSMKIIIAGDYNVSIDSDIIKGLLNQEHFKYKFNNAYLDACIYKYNTNNVHKSRYYFPTYSNNNVTNSIDHIQYTCNNLSLNAVTKTYLSECKEQINLPNNIIPSDHMPISCILENPNVCNGVTYPAYPPNSDGNTKQKYRNKKKKSKFKDKSKKIKTSTKSDNCIIAA